MRQQFKAEMAQVTIPPVMAVPPSPMPSLPPPLPPPQYYPHTDIPISGTPLGPPTVTVAQEQQLSCEWVFRRGARSGTTCNNNINMQNPEQVSKHRCFKHKEMAGDITDGKQEKPKSEPSLPRKPLTARLIINTQPTSPKPMQIKPPSPKQAYSEPVPMASALQPQSEDPEDDWIPAGAEIIDLPPIEGKEPEVQGDSKRSDVKTGMNETNAIKAIQDYYQGFPWLMQACPPESMEGVPAQEWFDKIDRLVGNQNMDDTIWHTISGVLPPVIQHLSTSMGKRIDAGCWHAAATVAKTDYMNHIMRFRIKHQVWIDENIGEGMKMALLLGRTAMAARALTVFQGKDTLPKPGDLPIPLATTKVVPGQAPPPPPADQNFLASTRAVA